MVQPPLIGVSSENHSGSPPSSSAGNNSSPSAEASRVREASASDLRGEPSGDGRPSESSGSESSGVDSPHERRYRTAPVRTVALPESFVEENGGAFTRKGTPRLDVLCAARGAYVQRKSDSADSDALQFDSGAYAFREDGKHVKSIQGHAEDIWRRIYKRPVPEGDPLDDGDFHRLYRRLQASLRRTDLLVDEGPAVPDSEKRVQDAHGKRWSLSDGLKEAERGQEIAAPPPIVRCTGPEIETDSADLWTRVERRVARENELHREFSHAVTASELDGPRWTADGRRFERRYAREGGDSPRYITVGRWRPEAVGRSDRRNQAVRVPWIVAEIDGRRHGGKDRGESDRLARRLLRRLDAFGVDLSDVVVSYSGNASIHVRIPDGIVGCPLYRNAGAAKDSIGRLFDRLCGPDSELRTAIDDACFRPGQMIRAIGSIHEATERQTVGTTADTFLEKPSLFLWSLSEPQFEYPPPEAFPLPRRGNHVSDLSALLDPMRTSPPDGEVETNVSQYKSGENGVRASALRRRLRGGVQEGEPWGLDVGRPEAVGRNWASLYFSLLVLEEQGTSQAAWTVVQEWNCRFNAPPLPEEELRGVFDRAVDYQRGYSP